MDVTKSKLQNFMCSIFSINLSVNVILSLQLLLCYFRREGLDANTKCRFCHTSVQLLRHNLYISTRKYADVWIYEVN